MNDNTISTEPHRSTLWCILRVPGNRTLPLVDSLTVAGLEVWTPRSVEVRKRAGQRKVAKPVLVEHEVPIASTFVFARAHHVAELLALAAQTVSQHPPFSVFRHAGRIPLISDADIDGLRQAEGRAMLVARRTKRRRLHMGQRVGFTDGAWSGLTGTIEKSGDNMVVVACGAPFRIKVATWLLNPDGVDSGKPIMGAAA